MRVLYVSKSFSVHDRRFISKIAGGGHEVHHVRFGVGAPADTRSMPPGARVVDWAGLASAVNEPGDVLPLMRDFERVLSTVKPDVVQAGPVQTCGLMAALSGFHPLVIQSWGSDILADAGRNDAWAWATTFALSRMDALQCDCEAVRRAVSRIRALPDDRVAQFPWGIDLGQFTPPGTPRPAPATADAVTVLSVRSWEPFYGIDVLLQAFRLARERDRRLRLVLAGDGSLAHGVHRFIAEHGLSGSVVTPGRLPNERLPDAFRAADLYASCAHNDGSSVSLIEAMATGLPAIVTDVESNAEWISHGVNGWLARAGDAKAVAECLVAACGLDAASRARMTQINRGIAEARADWAANSEALLRLYARLT